MFYVSNQQTHSQTLFTFDVQTMEAFSGKINLGLIGFENIIKLV